MEYCNFEELLKHNRKEKKSRLAVVSALEKETLQSVMRAYEDGYVEPMLIGDRTTIENNLLSLGLPRDKFEIHSAGNVNECLNIVTKLVKEEKVDIVMKDQVQTGDLMRTFVNKENKFLRGKILSHIAFNKLPNYHKLLCVTDTSLNIYPDLEAKKNIIENAVHTMTSMGFEVPKVAVLAAVEYLNPKMKETVDGNELKKMNNEGIIKNCVIEGPISFDLSIDKKAAKIKKYESIVAGNADLLVVPDLVSGNLLGKSLNFIPGSEFAGFIVGACVPIVLTSRASSCRNKYLSIALASLI